MSQKMRTRAPEAGQAPAVRVQRADRSQLKAPADGRFAHWIAAAALAGKGTVTVRLVGLAESRRLNEGFRGRSGPTNVLAFPADASLPAEEAELGDLVICLPLVYREAGEQGKKPFDHLAHLVVHGTLHLLGHDHDQPAKARRMEHTETKILRGLGIANPYRVRSSSVAGGRGRT